MDSKGASTSMDPSVTLFELIYNDDMIYESLINSTSILVHKGVLIIMQGCIGDNEQGLYIGLID